MPGPVSDKDGRLGYCWMHHFKCHSARACRTWAKGGPIKIDEKSYEWQEKNKNKIEEKWSEKYKKSIDCNNPKGFSQKAHCAGRKKKKP